MCEPWDFDIGEGAYHSDEENRHVDREPYPDELWDEEFNETFDEDN